MGLSLPPQEGTSQIGCLAGTEQFDWSERHWEPLSNATVSDLVWFLTLVGLGVARHQSYLPIAG